MFSRTRHFRGPTRQRQAKQKPDAEIHLVNRLKLYCDRAGLRHASEVDRGRVIADVLAYCPASLTVYVFEAKPSYCQNIRGAIRQLRQHSGHFKWVVLPPGKGKRSKIILDLLEVEGIGLLEISEDSSVTVVVEAEMQKMATQSRDRAIERIEEANAQSDSP